MVAAATALAAASIRNVQLFQELRDTAVTDSLTGCVNRARFLDMMGAELRRARRTGSPLSLLMLDLDGFKQVNDEDGHLAGDAALVLVARRLKELLRVSDVRCRYGGDEFLLLLPDTPLKGAFHVAEILRREIEVLGVRSSSSAVSVTASVGVAATFPGEIDPVYCIQRADRALYSAEACKAGTGWRSPTPTRTPPASPAPPDPGPGRPRQPVPVAPFVYLVRDATAPAARPVPPPARPAREPDRVLSAGDSDVPSHVSGNHPIGRIRGRPSSDHVISWSPHAPCPVVPRIARRVHRRPRHRRAADQLQR